MSTDHIQHLNAHLQVMGEQEDIDAAAGIRYLYVRTPEPLLKSLRRRASLLWQLLRLRPERDWRDEWEDFRQEETTMEKITSEHPDYATATIPNEPFFMNVLDQCPWTKLLEDKDFPENMGKTIK
jgi:hypothetical protein